MHDDGGYQESVEDHPGYIIPSVRSRRIQKDTLDTFRDY